MDVNLLHTYTYDGLNQLIRHDDNEVKKSYRYDYVNDTLRYTYIYPYTTGALSSAEKLIARFYMGNWRDQMTQFDGKSITYDEIGNVISYDGFTYDWEKGKQLSSITGNGLNMSFDYNSSGLRTQKTVNGETKQYFYSGDLLVSEYDGVEYINFAYSPSGEPVGFSFLDAEENEILGYYIYLKNIQGDIIGLIDFKGEIHCTYSYDAWGKFLGAYDKNGNEITNPNSVALSNPLRYRGYYYDDESGLYYLNSRYYNPEWGTFISADTSNVLDIQRDLYDKNLYAYCDNNPIIRQDVSGAVWETVFDVVSLGFSIAEVAANPYDVSAWIGLVGDAVDLIPIVTGVGETVRGLRFVDKVGNTLEIAKATDFTKDAKKTIKKLNRTNGFTKSTAPNGIKIHKGYKSGQGFVPKYKEFGRSSYGIRMDYYDGRTIFELKPYNQRSAIAGIKQLNKYNRILGGGKIMRLEFY